MIDLLSFFRVQFKFERSNLSPTTARSATENRKRRIMSYAEIEKGSRMMPNGSDVAVVKLRLLFLTSDQLSRARVTWNVLASNSISLPLLVIFKHTIAST